MLDEACEACVACEACEACEACVACEACEACNVKPIALYCVTVWGNTWDVSHKYLMGIFVCLFPVKIKES